MILFRYRLARHVARNWRSFAIRRKHFFLCLLGQVEIAPGAVIEPAASIWLGSDRKRPWLLRVGSGSRVKDHAYLAPRTGFIDIGSGSTINPFCVLLGYGGITIGNNVRIAAHCSIVAFSHNFDNVEQPIAHQGNNWRGIVIEDDVWIGTGVRVLDGVRIGKGAVVGAGSVVNRPIPAYAIAVGAPARVVRQRDASGVSPAVGMALED